MYVCMYVCMYVHLKIVDKFSCGSFVTREI